MYQLGRLPAWTKRRSFLICALVLAFAGSFALPLLIVGNFSGIFSENLEDRLGLNVDDTFPQSVSITTANSFLRVASTEALDPPTDKDFLLVAWFKLREFPSTGQRLVLLSKYDDKSRARRGYAIGLEGIGDGVRPLVYWKSGGGEGGWNVFSDIKLKPKSWFMVAVSFYSGKFLGVHVIDYSDRDKPRVEIAGGYDLSSVPLPRSNSDLVIGDFIAQEIKGRLGPVGIFNVRQLDQDLKQILESFAAEPLELPSRFDQANVIFWSIDGKQDLGKSQLKIEVGAADQTESSKGASR